MNCSSREERWPPYPTLAPPARPPAPRLLPAAAFGPQAFLQQWANALRAHGIRVHTYPHEIGDLSRVEFAVTFDPPPGLLHQVGARVGEPLLRPVFLPCSPPPQPNSPQATRTSPTHSAVS